MLNWCAIRSTAKTARKLAGISDFPSLDAARSENRFLMFATGLMRSGLKAMALPCTVTPPVCAIPAPSAATATAAITTAGAASTASISLRMAKSVGASIAGSQRAGAPSSRNP